MIFYAERETTQKYTIYGSISALINYEKRHGRKERELAANLIQHCNIQRERCKLSEKPENISRREEIQSLRDIATKLCNF